MSATHVKTSEAVVKEFYQCVGVGKFSEALNLMSASAVVEFFGPSEIPIAGRYRGHEEIRIFFDQIGANLQIEEFQVHEFIVQSEKVAVIGRERSTVLRTGNTFDVPWVQVFDVSNGKITRLRDYFETASLLQAFKDDVLLGC